MSAIGTTPTFVTSSSMPPFALPGCSGQVTPGGVTPGWPRQPAGGLLVRILGAHAAPALGAGGAAIIASAVGAVRTSTRATSTRAMLWRDLHEWDFAKASQLHKNIWDHQCKPATFELHGYEVDIIMKWRSAP